MEQRKENKSALSESVPGWVRPADWAAIGIGVLLLLAQLVSDTSNWSVVVLYHGCFFTAVSPLFREVTLGGRGLKHLSLAICFQMFTLP